MPPRIVKIRHDLETRMRIQASKIIDRLMDHIVADKPKMAPSQVSAALGLLRKTLPDLAIVAALPESEPQMVDVTPRDPLDPAIAAWNAAAAGSLTGNA